MSSAYFDFSGGSGDGFLEIRPSPAVKEGEWWSPNDGPAHEFRAGVLAANLGIASERTASFVDHALDRITFLAGELATLGRIEFLYNDDELEACVQGALSEYAIAPSGTMGHRVGRFRNPHAMNVLQARERVARSLRWLRKGMSFEDAEDRYLAYYISLEAISNEIKLTAETTHKCRHCGGDTGITKSQMDGAKELIGNNPSLPANAFQILTKTRSSIVHGGAATARINAQANEGVLQSLAVQGIAQAIGIDPKSANVRSSSTPTILPIASAIYDASSHPALKWGRTLREAIRALLAKQAP